MRGISLPCLTPNGVDENGRTVYLVTVYNPAFCVLANGVNKETALKIRDEYIEQQRKKQKREALLNRE